MGLENILVWNVRGLNGLTHREAPRELVVVERLSIVCLQETKLDVIIDFDVMQ
jgi:exonuclease III